LPTEAPAGVSRALLLGGLLLALAAHRPAAAAVCAWKPVLAPDHVRFPVQMDLHAAYAIYLFEEDGSVALKVSGRFPFAAFLSFTTSEAPAGLLTAALLDKDIAPDPGSETPFQSGNRVNAPARSYGIAVLPAGRAAVPNSLAMPAIPPGKASVAVALVMRIYLPEPSLDRLGGVPLPTITAGAPPLRRRP